MARLTLFIAKVNGSHAIDERFGALGFRQD